MSSTRYEATVFILKYVRSLNACMGFCDATSTCKGFVYWNVGVRVCLGLKDLGNERSTEVFHLAEAFAVEQWMFDPVSFKKV